MMYLVCNIDELSFGIPYSQIMEVIPLVKINEIPGSPDYIAGMINYRKQLIPVIDLQQIMRKRQHKRLMSTRIIIANNTEKEGIIGFITENTTDILEIISNEIRERKVKVNNADYIEKALLIDDSILFVLNINQIPYDLSSVELIENSELLND